MSEQKREFKGVWIPKEVWLNPDLNALEKCVLAEIDSLDNDEKGCFASNEYFGQFFGISEGRAANIISDLKKRGHVFQTFFDGRNRGLRVGKSESSVHENVKPELTKTLKRTSRKREHNNTVNNPIEDKEKDMSAKTADGLPEKPSLDANPSQEGKATPIPATPAKKVKADPPPPQPLDLSTCYQHFSDPAKMRALWERWLKYRKDIKKPLKTEDAIVTGLRLLYKWTSGSVATATEIVEKSIGSGYTGLIKPEPPKQPALFPQPAPYKLEPAPERKPIAAYTP